MSLKNPLRPTLTSLIEEHKMDVAVIPDFYLHTFAYLLGGESVVLEGFPVDLSVALLDLFVLEQAKSFQFEHSINLVFFGSDSRKISKLSSLNPPLLTTNAPTTSIIEVNTISLRHLSKNNDSNLKNLSVTLVLYQISSDLITAATFPPNWQVIILPLTKLEGLHLSINFLKIAQSDDVIRIERLQENICNSTKETPQNHTAVNIQEISLQAQSLCKNHGFPADMNDILLPTLIYLLLGQNVIMHTYSDINFIHVVGILASVYKTGKYGKLVVCIQNEENRKSLLDFNPSIRFQVADIRNELESTTHNNFLIDSSQFSTLKSPHALDGYTGILAILSTEPQLTRHIANLPTSYTLLIGTSYYSSDLLKIMSPFRFVLFSGYPICPAHAVGNKADEFELLDLHKLPSLSLLKPSTTNQKPKNKSKNASKKKKVTVPLMPTFTESRFTLEDHSDILLTSLLQYNHNLLVQYTSSFDYNTYFKYLISRVEKDSDALQVIIHADAPSIGMIFEQFVTSNDKHDCTVFFYCGGKVSSLKAVLVAHRIQILFIPTNELILFNQSVDVASNCKVLLYFATDDTSPPLSHDPLAYLHYEAQLATQVVLVFKGDCGVVSKFNTPFCHVQESSDLTKEQFSVNFCNYSLR